MADERYSDEVRPAQGLALNGAAMDSAEARDYLRRQSELTQLQIEDMKRDNRVRAQSLRFGHASMVMKVVFELSLAVVFVGVVIVLLGAVWSATHDDSLVIDAFKVPPDMAQKGLTGEVVASQLLDRLTALQDDTDSSRAPSTYASNWGSDIKVEIPDTGISIGEAYRYLAGWLGHQTHITGEVYRTAKGVALTVRAGGSAGSSFEGSENDLNPLLQGAAENVYRRTQPFRYAIYLTSHGRNAEEEVILRDLALNGPQSERVWAYTVWAYSGTLAGDMATGLARAHKAVSLVPDHPLALNDLAAFEAEVGHDEASLQVGYRTRAALDGSGAHYIIPRAASVIGLETEALIDEDRGDFRAAAAVYERLQNVADFEGAHWNSRRQEAADLALAHDAAASRAVLGKERDIDLLALSQLGFGWQLVNFRFAQFEQFAAEDNWPAARKDIEAALSTPAAKQPDTVSLVRAQSWPWLALAQAKTGDTKAARTTIGRTSLDCYLCLRVRGRIAAAAGDNRSADTWFALAAKQAPSLPFADADWGAMLLNRGDFAGAIAKFESAHAKGPHFADPLELWGDALMAQNRSDLALVKFSEAARYAPNWGRLHMKWGEALWWSGHKDEARKQYAIAAGLDLSPSDTSELARVRTIHG